MSTIESLGNKTFSLFVNLVHTSKNNEYLWLVLTNDTLENVEKHIKKSSGGEEDRFIIVKQDKPYEDVQKKLFTWEEIGNSIFCKHEEKLCVVPNTVLTKRHQLEEESIKTKQQRKVQTWGEWYDRCYPTNPPIGIGYPCRFVLPHNPPSMFQKIVSKPLVPYCNSWKCKMCYLLYHKATNQVNGGVFKGQLINNGIFKTHVELKQVAPRPPLTFEQNRPLRYFITLAQWMNYPSRDKFDLDLIKLYSTPTQHIE